ncbi:MAG: hypothetical protein N2Z70_07345 [Bdellovibrionaceae bacterium]|nr:hypothetical protein [Pseudobdellovibrionaceae bacterium]
MYLQGHLQDWFEALYQVGVIQRMLDLDWQDLQSYREQHKEHYGALLHQLNPMPLGQKLEALSQMSSLEQNLIALEVAYEFVQYESKQHLH